MTYFWIYLVTWLRQYEPLHILSMVSGGRWIINAINGSVSSITIIFFSFCKNDVKFGNCAFAVFAGILVVVKFLIQSETKRMKSNGRNIQQLPVQMTRKINCVQNPASSLDRHLLHQILLLQWCKIFLRKRERERETKDH